MPLRLMLLWLEKAFELANPSRMSHLPQSFSLNLANSLSGYPELFAYFLEGAWEAID